MADALSWGFPPSLEVTVMLTTHLEQWADLYAQVQSDPWLQKLTTAIQQGTNTLPGLAIEQGILKYKGRTVLPKGCAIIPTLLQEYHGSPVGGNSGSYKTYQRLAADWFWQGMKRQVQQWS